MTVHSRAGQRLDLTVRLGFTAIAAAFLFLLISALGDHSASADVGTVPSGGGLTGAVPTLADTVLKVVDRPDEESTPPQPTEAAPGKPAVRQPAPAQRSTAPKSTGRRRVVVPARAERALTTATRPVNKVAGRAHEPVARVTRPGARVVEPALGTPLHDVAAVVPLPQLVTAVDDLVGRTAPAAGDTVPDLVGLLEPVGEVVPVPPFVHPASPPQPLPPPRSGNEWGPRHPTEPVYVSTPDQWGACGAPPETANATNAIASGRTTPNVGEGIYLIPCGVAVTTAAASAGGAPCMTGASLPDLDLRRGDAGRSAERRLSSRCPRPGTSPA